MMQKYIMVSIFTIILISGLSACGKRGDPFRPSEIPVQQTTG